MTLGTQTKTFKDSSEKSLKVVCTHYPGRFGLRLFARLVKKLLPIASPFLDLIDPNSKQKLMDMDFDFKEIADSLVTHLDEDTIIDLIMEILSGTTVEDNPLAEETHFDNIFANDYYLLVQLIGFALEVNYKSFFGASGIKKLKSMIPIKRK